MSRLADLARAEPALIALAIIAVIGTVVLTVIALSMRAAGLSLRPVAWFAVFIGIIAVPQAAMHLGGALGLVQRPATWVPRVDAADTAGAVRADATPLAADLDALDVEVGPDGPRFRDPAHVFGADVRPAGVRDARAGFGGALDGAVAAQVAFLDYRQTVLAAGSRAPRRRGPPARGCSRCSASRRAGWRTTPS
jgi:hypothetical protein